MLLITHSLIKIRCGNAFGGSEEDAGGDVPGEEKVLDVVYNHNLTQTTFSKPEFMAYIKEFLKKLKANLTERGLTDRVDAFMKGAQEFVKFIVGKFDEVELYAKILFFMLFMFFGKIYLF